MTSLAQQYTRSVAFDHNGATRNVKLYIQDHERGRAVENGYAAGSASSTANSTLTLCAATTPVTCSKNALSSTKPGGAPPRDAGKEP